MSKYRPEDWPPGTCVLHSFGWIRLAEGVIVKWSDDGEYVKIEDDRGKARWFETNEVTIAAALSRAAQATEEKTK